MHSGRNEWRPWWLVLTLAAGVCTSTHGETVYGFDSTGSLLVTLDPSTGAAREIGPVETGGLVLNDLAAFDDRLFALLVEPLKGGNIVEIDPETAEILSEAVVSIDGEPAINAVEALAASPDGTLYVALWQEGAFNIFSSNSVGVLTLDGAVTDIVDFGGSVDADWDGLVWEGPDQLVSLNREPGPMFVRLDAINLAAPAFAQIIQIPFSATFNLVDDPILLDGDILTFDAGTKRINRHDRDTGEITSFVTYPSEYSVATAAVVSLPPACFADLNDDGTVDGADLGLLLGGWGDPGPGDLDDNGTIDGADLGLLLGAWGPCR